MNKNFTYIKTKFDEEKNKCGIQDITVFIKDNEETNSKRPLANASVAFNNGIKIENIAVWNNDRGDTPTITYPSYTLIKIDEETGEEVKSFKNYVHPIRKQTAEEIRNNICLAFDEALEKKKEASLSKDNEPILNQKQGKSR